MRFLWNAYGDLARARTGSGFGANPISFGEIYAWTCLMQLRLAPWEVETLRRIDDAFLTSLAEDPT